jgi:hypothetical protein
MSYAEYFTMRLIHDFCDVCIVLITMISFFPRLIKGPQKAAWKNQGVTVYDKYTIVGK